jgi:hypothetical protein
MNDENIIDREKKKSIAHEDDLIAREDNSIAHPHSK